MENDSSSLIAKKELENFFINSNIDIDFGNFFIALLLSLILAYLVKPEKNLIYNCNNRKDKLNMKFNV